MEKRQLDFNAPFLSVRRYSSPSKHEITEKPLPHRQQSLPPNRSDWQYEDVVKPVSVPFHWEHTPGRPKCESENPTHSGPTRYNFGEHKVQLGSQIEAYDHASLLEKLNESLNCKNESDSESEENAYSDAFDSLSGSCSLNYSVSGLSDDSGAFSIDTQTRDFMMNRFLPAAKAVVLETPQHVVKKSKILNEEPKEVKKVFKQYSSGDLLYNSRYRDDVESEDEDHEPIVPVKKRGKAWGILKVPRFFVKSSLCLLNPLPAMKSKSKSRPPTPSNGEVTRLKRNAYSGPLDKNACDVPQKIKFHSGLLSRDLPEISTKLTNDSGLSPFRQHSNRSGSISPYRNESPKSPFREGMGFLGVPKQVENHNANKIAYSRKLFKALQDVSRNQINERVSLGPPGEDVEKILYIDSVTKTDSHILKSMDTSCRNLLGQGKRLNLKSNQNVGKESNPMESHLTPPLPKSPSESWLWRSGSPLRCKKQGAEWSNH